MKAKNFIVSGFSGGIVYFLLGWLFYGIIFNAFFPQSNNSNILFLLLGSLTFGFFVSYILNRFSIIKNPAIGLQIGATIGFFYSLSANFFTYSSMQVNYENMTFDILISLIIGAFTGASIAFVNGKL